VPGLPSFREVKHRPDGRREVFPCRLLARSPRAAVLYYRLSRRVAVDGIRLAPGFATVAYYWAARPYNLYHWVRPNGRTAGFYFNAARDTALFADRVEWTDLGLDLLVRPGGRASWIDEEEVASLPPRDQAAVARTRRRLQREYPRVVAWAEARSAVLRRAIAAS
jgi:predicted RNA-binding protein associated with RNAse of E/G family